ncbi:Zn-binding Pro-Ala-Ala-Arg (PAAR) domain-containing protein, incolved in TypeVI secretion [Pasteurella testudinis DSM 23072]|uniref:Zn-binding Pro-Ala-Ala-Arg (PAAR) domain-containing protein, incolved in TypeVI secretion n=1 Tax=Pasteurella testudinis DSM 23072 TaxID=1122938 RepID=A0A1W1V3T4_9PAST|nr:PAAR domain-containing protein [Pasteurella testudinis]SMB87955.1 Zn-binding Pro-Ala-Ala-Arg (PAAR) domain-containing protein, incolved in TypeVI secretion [Pasteurella testudinis DSM 23072]SUB52177.1 Uncharacterized conserved protein [Pasteurella testudinis]
MLTHGEQLAADAVQRITARINNFPRSQVRLVGAREVVEPAARVGDKIKHKSLLGAIAGAVVGGIVASAPYILVGFLGPFGAAARISMMLYDISQSLNTNTSQISEPSWAEQATEATSRFIDSCLSGEDGYITQGSGSIFINGKPAAFASLENAISCNDHSLKIIASGSETVSMHNQPAARKGDQTSCGAKIITASPNVFIGSGTATVADIAEDFSPREKVLIAGIEMFSPPSVRSIRKGLGKIRLGILDIQDTVNVVSQKEKYHRNLSERRKALLRDAKNPKTDLDNKARQYIQDNNGKKVPKGYEVSHEEPLYTADTIDKKKKLDIADNMLTQRKDKHRMRHKICGEQYHIFGPANKPKINKSGE